MNRKLWAVILAAAVMIRSVLPISYMDVQTASAAAAAAKPGAAAVTTVAQKTDTSTDGKITAEGFTYRVNGNNAIITGYNGIAQDITIPTKIQYVAIILPTSPTGATKPSATKATAAKATKTTATKTTATKATATKPTTATAATESSAPAASTPANPSPSAIKSQISLMAAKPTKATGAASSTQKVLAEYSVTEIEKGAFSGQLSLLSVSMAGGMDSTGKSYGIEKIGEKAFFACPDLTKVTIAATTTSIGRNAFSDCVSLSSMTVSEGNPKYKVIDGSLYSYSTETGTGSYTLVQYPLNNAEKTYAVPQLVSETLAEIGEGAFWGSVFLETIAIPPTVKVIGEGAFAECRKLKGAALPNGLTTIGAEAFKGAVSLAEITIPSSVTAINSRTFQDCAALKTVNLPNTLRSISSDAFQGCRGMETFTVPSSVTLIGDRAFAQCTALREIAMPAQAISFGNEVFRDASPTLLCFAGSQAETYAADNGLPMKYTYKAGFYSDESFSTLLSSQNVVDGRAAQPPNVAAREGYRMKWSGDYSAVRQDSSFYPVWEKVYNVQFVDVFNGRTETVVTGKGEAPVPPAWTMEGYSLSWDQDIYAGAERDFAIHAVWQNDISGEIIDPTAVRPQAVGTSLSLDNNLYVVVSDNFKKPAVKLTGLEDAKVKKADIPASIAIDGVKYRVVEVAEKAVRKNLSITTLTVGKNVKKIGESAFQGCTNLKTLKLQSKSITSIGIKAFGKIAPKPVCFTYSKKLAKYKAMLEKAGIKKLTMKQL